MDTSSNDSCVYVLKCTNEKYYVGRTTDVVLRFNKHVAGLGAKWCTVYKPLAIVELLRDSPFLELVLTLRYMQTFGIDNVRGGPWCQVVMPETDKAVIAEMLRSETFAREPTGPTEGFHVLESEAESRKGKKWTDEEDKTLVSFLTQSASMTTASAFMKRSEGALRSRVGHIIRALSSQGLDTTKIASTLNLVDSDVHLGLMNSYPEIVKYLRSG